MNKEKVYDDELAKEEKLYDILHPSTRVREFKITVEFGYNISKNYEKAVELAHKHPTYTKKGSGEWVRHSATYTPRDVEELFELFNLVHEWENVEILVNHKRIPYALQLWILLMWFYRIK